MSVLTDALAKLKRDLEKIKSRDVFEQKIEEIKAKVSQPNRDEFEQLIKERAKLLKTKPLASDSLETFQIMNGRLDEIKGDASLSDLDELEELLADQDSPSPFKLTHSDEGLDKTEDSKAPFANPKLLEIAKIPIPKEGFVSPEDSKYSDNVIQAVWNIADIASNSIESKSAIVGLIFNQLRGKSPLTPNFQYLDATWVPRIIDDKTYQVGKALQGFLTTVIADTKTFEIIPETIPLSKTNPREQLLNSLSNLQKTLENRLTIYEVHSEENLGFIKLKVERRKLLFEHQRKLLEENDLLERKILENFAEIKELNTTLATDSESLEKLTALMEKVEAQESQVLTLSSEFDSFAEEWHEENLKLGDLPPNVNSSSILMALTAGRKNIKSCQNEWLNLFNNQQEVELYEENMATGLEGDYKYSKQRAQRLSEDGVTITQKQIELIKEQINAAEQLKDYETQLKEFVAQLPLASKSPEIIIRNEEGVDFQFTKSSNEDNSERLIADIESYVKLIKELERYKTALSDHKIVLAEQKDLVPANPYTNDELPDFKPAFDNARLVAQAEILSKIDHVDEQINEVNTLLQKATEMKKASESELAKQSQKGREDALRAAENLIGEVDEARLKSEESGANIAKAYSNFIQEQYNPGVDKVNETYKLPLTAASNNKMKAAHRLSLNNNTLEHIKNEAAERMQFLDTAELKLQEFKKAVVDTTLYVPTKKVPKDNLLEYLEFSDEFMQSDDWRAVLINRLYNTAEEASGLLGIRNNLSNLSSHFFVLFSQSEFDIDLSYLIEIIDEKLKQIKEEKQLVVSTETSAISFIATDMSQHSEPKGLATSNLYALGIQHQQTNQEKAKEEETLDSQTKEYERLTKEKKAALDQWDADKTEHEQAVNRSKQETQLLTFEHNLAQIAHASLSFEYKMDEVESVQKVLNNIIPELETKPCDEAQALFESKQATIEALDGLSEAEELHQTLEEKLSAQEELVPGLTEIPAELAEKAKRLKDELIGLKRKQEALGHSFNQLTKAVPETKTTIEKLGKLAQIENEYTKLLARTKAPELDEQAKLELAEEIENTYKKHNDFIEENSNSNNKAIQHRIKAIGALKNGRDKLSQFIFLARLSAIESKYAKLVERTKTPEMDGETRRKLVVDINNALNDPEDKQLLEIASLLGNAPINKKIAAINNLVTNEDGLIMEHLARIESEYASLLERTKTPAMDSDAKNKLAVEIRNTVNNKEDQAFIQKSRLLNNGPINEKIAAINKLVRNKTEALERLTPQYHFKGKVDSMVTKYFGEESQKKESTSGLAGVFGDYLNERAQTYWLKDMFSLAAALFLRCIKYKTDAQERKEFIEDLQETLTEYQKTPDELIYMEIEENIKAGLKKFPSRAQEGSVGYENSLFSKLTTLQADIKIIDGERIKVEENEGREATLNH